MQTRLSAATHRRKHTGQCNNMNIIGANIYFREYSVLDLSPRTLRWCQMNNLNGRRTLADQHDHGCGAMRGDLATLRRYKDPDARVFILFRGNEKIAWALTYNNRTEATKNGRVTGCYECDYWGGKVKKQHWAQLFVKVSMRGQGFGKKLLKRVTDTCGPVIVFDSNENSGFFKSVGLTYRTNAVTGKKIKV
jgi:GNAT superfamily N-acetyltransferase